MTLGERIKQRRMALGFNQTTLADIVGITKQQMYKYENDVITNIPSDKIESIAQALRVSPAYLMGWIDGEYPSDIIALPNTRAIPLVGQIACGTPILAEENVEEEIELPEHIKADFALRCRGDSMVNARIHDGDIVYIRQQPMVNNGEIAAVLIGEEATLKRVYASPNTLILQAANPSYEPMVFTGEQLESVRVLGKAVGFTSADI
jgi:repressor LexA